jgi:hypothetical protein
MKKHFLIPFLMLLIFGGSGCTSSNLPVQPLPVMLTGTLPMENIPPVATQTNTPYPTLTRWPTYTPSLTPTLAQIPRSTFDPAKAILQTSLPPAQCPNAAQDVSLPDLETLNQSHDFFETTIVEALSAGGISQVISTLSQSDLYTLTRADVTHDHVSELIIENRYELPGFLSVFGCEKGRYKKLLTAEAVYDYAPSVLKIKDMNRNGIPDLVLKEITCHYCLGVQIFEWNGQEFEGMARAWYLDPSLNELDFSEIVGIDGYAEVKITDIDGNGTDEIIFQGGASSAPGDMYLNGPYRSLTIIYMWDGQFYSQYSSTYSPPEYRFQAVQDGDDSALRGATEKALAFYQDVIFSDQLKGWSDAEMENLRAQADVMFSGTATPTPVPPHNEDYLPLAAYARYRIMLLHTLLGFQADAQVVYDTLQEKFPEGNAGHSYAEMAAAFWEEYLASRDIRLSCQKAIDYASAHPDILTPLEGPPGGFWSRSYQPFDVCPFPAEGQ